LGEPVNDEAEWEAGNIESEEGLVHLWGIWRIRCKRDKERKLERAEGKKREGIEHTF